MLRTQIPHLYLEKTAKGRAVFTGREIESNSIIEICPVIVLSKDDSNIIHQTKLHDYYFMWDMNEETCAIALGYGSLYNHSEKANAEFEILHAEKEIQFKSLGPIEAGEEICINYISLKNEGYGLWFTIKWKLKIENWKLKKFMTNLDNLSYSVKI